MKRTLAASVAGTLLGSVAMAGLVVVLNIATPSAAGSTSCSTSTTAPPDTTVPIDGSTTILDTSTSTTGFGTTTTGFDTTTTTGFGTTTTGFDTTTTSPPDTSGAPSTTPDSSTTFTETTVSDTALIQAQIDNNCTDPSLPPPTLLATGTNHTCALPGDGTVECWGRNHLGQLGNGKYRDTGVHVTAVGIVDAVSVEAVDDSTCVLRASGNVACWGSYLVADQSAANTPTDIPEISTAIALLGNGRCALLADFSLSCWRWDQTLQPPDGPAKFDPSTLLKAPMNGPASCALLGSGSVRCWGGPLRGYFQPFPDIEYVNNAVDVSVGADFACALKEDRTVGCWGYNEYLELGTTYSPSFRSSPYVLPLQDVTSLSASGRHACAVLASGDVWCWGTNKWGELGSGQRSAIGVWGEPLTQVKGVHDAIAVSAGNEHTCVLRVDHSVHCWGANFFGQLGKGVMGYAPLPTSVFGLSNAVGLTAGEAHSCALLDDGSVQCWGINSFQQLGDGTTTSRDYPGAVQGVSGAIQVSAGTLHTCALLTGGSVMCWGSNANGQLGSNGPRSEWVYPTSAPILVPDVSNATQVVAGYRHSCALLVDATVTCWGASGPVSGAAEPVANLSSVVKLVTPWIDVTCALRSDHTVWCWGGWADMRYPRSSLTGAIDIAGTPYSNLCGLLADGSVRCMSDPNTTANVDVAGASAVSAGALGGCALISAGARCWGWNSEGFLGNDTVEPLGAQVGPQEVLDLDSVSRIESGEYHSCALLTSGTVKCWGANQYGQIGAGITALESVTASARMKVSAWGSTRPALSSPVPLSVTPDGRVDGIGVASSPQKVKDVAVTPPPNYQPTLGGTTTTTTSTTSTTSAASSSTTSSASTTNPTSSTNPASSSTTSGASTTNPTSSTNPGASSTTVAPTPTAGAVPGNRTAKITWSSSAWPSLAPITSFQLQRSSDGGATWRPVSTLARTKRSHTVLRLTNGANYRFRIRAMHGKIADTWIESNAVTPRTVPSQPRLVRAVGGNGSLTVTWQIPLSNGGAAITEFRVQTSTNRRAWSAALTVSPVIGAAQSTVIAGLPNGIKQFVRVVAVNIAGTSRATVSRKVAPLSLPQQAS